MVLSLHAEAKIRKEAEESMPVCVTEQKSFISTNVVSFLFNYPYPIPHTTFQCTLELFFDFFVHTLAAEDCGGTSTKTLKKDRMRQGMEIRGHGKLIAALTRWKEWSIGK